MGCYSIAPLLVYEDGYPRQKLSQCTYLYWLICSVLVQLAVALNRILIPAVSYEALNEWLP